VLYIIGAGAAGLFAALSADETHKTIQIIDHQPLAGSKLIIAGGGRCNISNSGDLLGNLHQYRFLRPALASLDFDALTEVLRKIPISITTDSLGRAYPQNTDGRGFALAVENHLKDRGVAFTYGRSLTGLQVEEGRLRGIVVDGSPIPASQVILATGGASWPGTGCDGSAFKILKQWHTIHQPLPALVPLKTAETWPADATGISLSNIPLTLSAGSKILDTTRGDLLFTHFGLSGPAVLDISWAAARALADSKVPTLTLDLLPQLTLAQLLRFFGKNQNKTAANALSALLPKQLARLIAPDSTLKGLAPSTLEKKVRSIKEQSLTITGTLGMKGAMVTQGGIELKEVNPRTMESQKVQGLFLAGELLDYHGRTGGFNIHAAFATGYLAGKNI
jgi:predicted Rossmann fold flavoprotein